MYDTVITGIKDGLAGKNITVPYSIPPLNKYTSISNSEYTLVMASPGGGKSSFLYTERIYIPLKRLFEKRTTIDITTLLFSLEIPADKVYMILTANYIYDEIGIAYAPKQLLLKVPDKRLIAEYPKEILKTLETQKYKDFAALVGNKLTIVEKANDKTLIGHLQKFAMDNKNLINLGNKEYKFVKQGGNKIAQVCIDHIGLIAGQGDDYTRLKAVSNYLANTARNKFGYSVLVLQQINPEKENFKGKDRVHPAHENLRGLKETYQDADTVISIGNPFTVKEKIFGGYNIIPCEETGYMGLGNRARSLQVQKGRDGGVSFPFVVELFGKLGRFRMLPKPEDINYADYEN